jgi:hypothetical protein
MDDSPEFTGYLSESYSGTALASNDDTLAPTESLPV